MTSDPAVRRGPGRPKGVNPSDTRTKALDSATELFGRFGFRGTSLAQVAQNAGLSQSGLLHHYPSKVHLLAGVLQRRDESDQAYLASMAQRQTIGWEEFDELYELTAMNAERPGLVKLYATISGEAVDTSHPAHDWLLRHASLVRTELIAALNRGKEAGTVHPDMPVESIARITMGVLDGLQVQWLIQPDPQSATTSMSEDFDIFVATLKQRWATS